MSPRRGRRQCAIERVLEVAAEFIIPSDLSISTDNDNRRKRCHPKRIDRRICTIAVHPRDAMLLDESFAFRLAF